jgi:hypothetical protein
MGFTSASGPAMAILHEDLFTGEVVGYLDRTGTIDLKSALDPDVRCVGSFRYTGAKTGVAQVRCNDGNEAQLSFNSITALSGYGYGKSSRGPVSFTYGLTAEQSMKYLTLPRGRRLIRKPEGLRLERDI